MPSTWASIKELHRSTTLGAKEGIAFRYFSRPLASFSLYYLQRTRITPNQITILSLIVGIAGFSVHMVWLTWAGLIVGGALFMLAHVLDALDGQLARLKKAGSVVGMYFDFFIDELKAYALYVAIGLRFFLLASRGEEVRFLGWLIDRWGPAGLLITTLVGLTGLAIGISATQFLKRKEWQEAFPSGDGTGKKSLIARLVGLAETGGRFVIDYPSYIVILCLANAMEIYFIAYTAAVCLYAVQALSGITLKLWRVNPYKD